MRWKILSFALLDNCSFTAGSSISTPSAFTWNTVFVFSKLVPDVSVGGDSGYISIATWEGDSYVIDRWLKDSYDITHPDIKVPRPWEDNIDIVIQGICAN